MHLSEDFYKLRFMCKSTKNKVKPIGVCMTETGTKVLLIDAGYDFNDRTNSNFWDDNSNHKLFSEQLCDLTLVSPD